MFSIASINVQNKYKLKKYDGLYNGEDHVLMLNDLIKKYDLDVVGLQEVNYRYFTRLKEILSYNMYGKFRFSNFFLTRIVYPFSIINESVPIISRNNFNSCSTRVLPWIKSYVPRIVTIVDVEVKGIGVVTILNTHLDYMKNKTKVKQIKKIYEIIKDISNPIILMGDFNMTLKNNDFKEFIRKLEELNIYRVNICENTFKNHTDNYSIDHIFVSDCFIVKDIILEKDRIYDNFSDHFPVIVKLDIINK